MPWGVAAAAGIGALGSAFGGSKSKSGPPGYVKEENRNVILPAGRELYLDPNNYPQYPTTSPVSPMNPGESAAISAYGALGDRANILGDYYAGNLSNILANNPNDPYASGFSQAPSLWNQQAQQGPQQVQAPNVAASGVDPNLGLYGSTAGINADPNAALQRMLSGQVDTTQLNEGMNAAINPVMRNFEQRVLPQVLQADDAYSGGQGGSGKTKIAQRLTQDLNAQLLDLAGRTGYSAYTDALNRRDTGANIATGAQLSQSGQNLQGAGLGINLGQAQAGNQYQYDSMNTGNNMTGQLANQGAYFDYLNSTAQAGGVGSTAAARSGVQDLNAMGQIPNVYNLYGAGPGAYASAGGIERAVTDPQYANQFAMEQYNANLPFNMLSGYSNLVNGVNAGTTTSSSAANPVVAGILGGVNGYLGYQQPQAAIAPQQRLPTYDQNVANNWQNLV